MTIASAERPYTRAESAADTIIHVAGVLFAIDGSLWLLSHVTGLDIVASVSVYCAGLFVMLTASAAYHLWPPGNGKDRLRRFDHAAIFVMIAATYTPFAVNRLAEPASGTILGLVWLAATLGVVVKLLYPHRFEIASLALYLAMGWLVVTVIRPLSAAMAKADFALLVAGGLVYSAGILFYLLERIPYHKAIWHGFVLVAVILHFAAIASEFAS
ncbi:MAG TPA: hemolysin III family protein [Rhizomicrobium sp.]|jgi:hemolysin III